MLPVVRAIIGIKSLIVVKFELVVIFELVIIGFDKGNVGKLIRGILERITISLYPLAPQPTVELKEEMAS